MVWLKPETVAQIDFQEWTSAYMLRVRVSFD
jgi:hypothetical protein